MSPHFLNCMLRSLATVCQVGGEAFRPSLIPLITHSRSLRNVYGPTETTIWSSSFDFGGTIPYGPGGHLVVPIGKPISKVGLFSTSLMQAFVAYYSSIRCLRPYSILRGSMKVETKAMDYPHVPCSSVPQERRASSSSGGREWPWATSTPRT